jgi:Tfp pilus assembly PilM family ATPase
MTSSLNHVGFNLTKNKLQLVEVVIQSMKYCLENVDEHIFEEEFDFNSDNSNIISILQTSLNSLTERNLLNSENISFTLPISTFTIFEIPYESSLSQEALEEHIKWEYSILSPIHNVDEQIVRFHKLTRGGTQDRILVVGISRLLVESIYKFAAQNNLNLMFVNISHIASDGLTSLSQKKVLSIYLDDSMFSISSYIDKKLKTMKMYEKSSNLDVLHSVELFVDNENITYDNIFIAGIGEIDEFKIELESILSLTAEIINPFESIHQSDSFIQNAYFMNQPNSFSAAAGICFRKFK